MTRKNRIENVWTIAFKVAPDLTRYMIEKGSVAVDGISLTINARDTQGFSITVIPLTAEVTTLGFKDVGASVNIETDMIGKYVEQLAAGRSDRLTGKASKSSINLNFLEKTGFL
jgi:riboflavin synthase